MARARDRAIHSRAESQTRALRSPPTLCSSSPAAAPHCHCAHLPVRRCNPPRHALARPLNPLRPTIAAAAP
eukprot:4518621-Prymnesium_polylepis.1